MISQLYDILRFCRKLSFRRIINLLLVYLSFQLSKWTKKGRIWGMPVTLSFEPTTACNLRCPECPSGLRQFTRPTGNMDKGFFTDLIEDIHTDLTYLIFYFQGEPYLHPEFLEMVALASTKGIYTITSTNGHFLNNENAKKTVESGLDRLIISVDGTTQDVYESYRKGGKLATVLEGANNVVKWKKQLKKHHPYIIFQFLVVKPNEHQIPEIKQMAKDLGVDAVKLKTAQVYDYRHGNSLIPQNQEYSRYHQREDGTYQLKNKLLNQCWKMWHSAVITWDGKVVPCCFDKDAQHILGSVQTHSFTEVWHSKEYNTFRNAILRGRDQMDICSNCTEGTRVWA